MKQEHGQASMVEKGCERCREWQEHYFREHIDVTKIRFFRRMTGDFAHRISIPEKFTKNLKGQITQEVQLKSPTSAETWNIGVEKHGDELLFVSRWEDFVKARGLQENDLLLFTCCGNSSFEVIDFEANGCEKVSSLFGKGTDPDMSKQFNDIVVGQHGEHLSVTVSDSEDTAVPSQLVGYPHNASSSKEPSGKAKRSEYESPKDINFKHVATGEEDSDDGYANCNYYYSMFANRLGDEEKEEIIGLASIQPNNPAFVTVLRKNQVQRRNNCLIIPTKFAADHLVERTHDIILRRPNRKQNWLVRYHYSSYTRCFQNLALFNFMRENKLREDDICVFELMKAERRVVMTVHVIRKGNDQFVLIG